MDGTVGAGDLKLDSPDEARPSPRGVQIPDQECRGHRGGSAGIDKAKIGTRLQCRVQIPVRSRRPSPNSVLGQLTIRLLVQYTAADVSTCLCIEQPDSNGIG